MRIFKFVLALFVILLLVLVGSGLYMAISNALKPKTRETTAVSVNTITAEIRPFYESYSYTGTVHAERFSVIAAQVASTVKEIAAEAGDHVEAGQVLAVLDQRLYSDTASVARSSYEIAKLNLASAESARPEQIAQAQAAHEAARVAAETAHANFQRQKNLFEEGVISRAQFENAEVLYEAARAQFTSAKENLRIAKTGARAEDKESLRLAVEMAGAQRRIAETNLAHTNIVAPYAGGLLKRMIDVGDFVAPGVAAFELVSTDGLKVEFYVPVDKIELIAVGQEATVLLDRHEAPLDATVSHVVASADPDTRLFKVDLALPRGSDVRANEFAEVAIRWLLGDGTVVVPTGAILAPASDEPYVFTVQDGKARRVPVSIGLRNGTCAQIIEPLVGGETVIVSGQTYVADGTPVRANSFDEPCDTPVDGNTESAGAAQ